MTISLKHAYVNPVSDDGLTETGPSEWNAEHVLTQATGKLLGRTTAGTGATEEITPSSPLSFAGGALGITGAALTRTDDTNVTLTLAGAPTTALLAATSITVGWTGTLSIARGGTNAATASAAFDNLKQAATTSATGVVELSTDTEARALSDTGRALTPSNLAAVLATDVQTFTASGTWTKPAQGRLALVQIIGAAGGGARRSAGNGSGGGCGAYFERLYLLSALGATEAVTIGAGGAVQSTDSTNGNNGGTTSFGSHITIYGGRGGVQVAAGTLATGGGAATFFDTWTAGSVNQTGYIGGITVNEAASGASAHQYGAAATGATSANVVQVIGFVSFQGPAGGAGHSTTGPVSGTANTSQIAGSGGAGNGAGAGGNGASPGGGGGSGTTQGGSGGDGRIIVTVF